MRAMMAERWCEPRELVERELPDPVATPGHVVLDLHAAGCNFPDLLMIQGKYQVRPPLPFAPGGEAAGVVRSVGEGVRGLEPGQRVLAIVPYGAYATAALVPAPLVHPIPDAMPFDEAAAFTIVYQTSYFALVHRAPLIPGQTLLVHGAAGGVGVSAVQIGKALGAKVLATASTAEKRAFALAQGADAAFDASDASWVEAVKDATNGRGVDHVYDPVGGDTFERSIKCLAFGGNLHVIGFASGTIPSCAMNRVLLKNISLVGLHWGAYLTHDPAKVPEAMTKLFAMYGRGELNVRIGARFPLADAALALEALGSRGAIGKIVLDTR